MPESVSTNYVGIILAMAISICIIGIAIDFQSANNIPANNTLISNPLFSSLNATMSNLASSNQGYQKQIQSLNSSTGGSALISFGWIVWTGIIDFGKMVITLPVTLYSALTSILGTTMGIVVGSILNLIGLAIVVYLIVLVVRFWRQGM